MTKNPSNFRTAKYMIGQVVRHRVYPFRGVVFDVDPVFDNTEEWWLSIPEDVRPRKDQPFYHLFAENAETEYVAYVSEQNLLPDTSEAPVRHPQVAEVKFALKILAAMPDGTGAVMIDGKMQDDATWKQAKVVVDLAKIVAAKDPEMKDRYGM